MKKQEQRTSSGWTMTGICCQWAKRSEMTNNEYILYTDLIDKTFSQKRKYCFMKYEEFSLSNKNTISKTLNLLESKKIIQKESSYKENGNKSKNKYTVLEPKDFINRFIFNTLSDDKSISKYELTDEEKEWES